MEKIIEKYQRRIENTQTRFVRSLMDDINWNARLIGIKGSRGVGKTTLILQYIKLFLSHKIDETLYVSLDNIWFSENRFTDLADDFYKRGGRYLFVDEVHKYPDWSVELKNIYDDYPEMKIVFTGSSLLEILNARSDLSRRAVVYTMQGLSFREYLNMQFDTKFDKISLDDIINNHPSVSRRIVAQLQPLKYFDTYLKKGYYPYFAEFDDLYYSRIEEVVNMILEIELPQLRNVNIAWIPKLKQIMLIVAESAPFVPNISKLSQRVGINRETMLAYIWNLNQAHLLANVYRNASGISRLQKPDKLFLENPNLMYALGGFSTNQGNVKETFFVNQLKYRHKIEMAAKGDFLVDSKYIFEIGGKNKNNRQIKDEKNAYIAVDNVEYGTHNRIPLWLFGFLY
ncbi:MAG: AAA family ATPase [Prolixibacteraceae bacterium]|nr:AAA family ATPase [Prolixibacteraceae bacterium]